MTDLYSIHTLSNGIRILHMPCADSGAEYFGVAINAGSADEDTDNHGLAHFVEHTIFKGTQTRRPHTIIRHLESIGGEINAFTSKEETVVYSVVPKGYVRRSIDLISDLIANPTFPADGIARERNVIADELDSYLDQPAEAVADDFEDLFYNGTPLGHNILGNKQSIQRFDTYDCLRWVTEHFVPSGMVAFYAGPERADRIFRIVEQYLGSLDRNDSAREASTHTPASFDVLRDTLDLHQAHTIIGAAVPGYNHGPTPEFNLLTNMLGGPRMNAMLNIELRERRGLVYTVDAALTHFTDTGLFTIYFGCDPQDTSRCRRIINRVISGIADKPLGERRLLAAKKQYLGQLTLAAENIESLAISRARNILRYGDVRSIARQAEDIMAVESCRISEAALTLLNHSTLTLM